MVGLSAGKAIALALDKPLIAVNHLEGHAVSARLGARIDYPFLLLLVSGGHCQLLEVQGVGRCRRLGSTLDDAAGEAFDKIAKSMGQPIPAVRRWSGWPRAAIRRGSSCRACCWAIGAAISRSRG